MMTKTRIVRIGNSRGIRVPKILLDQAQLPDEVELHAEPDRKSTRLNSSHVRISYAVFCLKKKKKKLKSLIHPQDITPYDSQQMHEVAKQAGARLRRRASTTRTTDASLDTGLRQE